MKRFFCIVAFSFIAINSFAADGAVTNDSPAAQKERLYQRFVKEMQQRMQEMQKLDPSNSDLSFTNAEGQSALRMVFESAIVDPTFGLEWDEVPAPTLVGSNALSGVEGAVRQLTIGVHPLIVNGSGIFNSQRARHDPNSNRNPPKRQFQLSIVGPTLLLLGVRPRHRP